MQRYVAFLRAINVGGHTVKMDRLRSLIASLGFHNVKTFIASGNVILDAEAGDPLELEDRIERQLEQALGYEVVTFLRSPEELAGVAAYRPFDIAEPVDGHALSVAFLKKPPGDAERQRLIGLRNEIDDFVVHGREVYWLRRNRPSESKFSGAVLERTLGMPATIRNVTTVRKLALKYPADF